MLVEIPKLRQLVLKSVVVQQVRKMQQMLVEIPKLRQLVLKSVVVQQVREIALMLVRLAKLRQLVLKSVAVLLAPKINSKAPKAKQELKLQKGKKGRP
jgi:hypothetical protein